MNIPINRWTILAVVVASAIFGGDFVSSIMKAVAVMTMGHLPAV